MSKQNYTIFINRSSISILNAPVNFKVDISLVEFKKHMQQCLIKAKKEPLTELHFEVETSSPKKLMEHLKKELRVIQAAGGIVEENGKYLYIERFGYWDLPKGKIEKNEKIRTAAIREVEEECGVTNLEITRELPSTYHIYMFQDKPAIKETFWFLMRSTKPISKLTPQTEEGITSLKFESKDFLIQKGVHTYNNLVHLIRMVEGK